MTDLTDRFDTALAYASRIHRDQKRKGTAIPYVSHLMSVSALVLEHGGDEDQAIAALLHDAAEDQGGAERLADIEARFGPTVAKIVADCTDSWVEPKPPWKKRKLAYLEALPGKDPRSLLVNLADKTHNARAIVSDLTEHGDALWSRFTGGRDGSCWYYQALAEVFAKAMPGRLANDLQWLAGQMRAGG